MSSRMPVALGVLCALLFVVPAEGGIVYTDRVAFEATLSGPITDPFSAPGYFAGDALDVAGFDIHTNAHMSAVLGETDFFTTGWDNLNIIDNQGLNPQYNAGSNGSFRLIFGTTSVGTSLGVFGAGFDVRVNSSSLPYHAYITYGDGGTEDHALPVGSSFFGVTSADLVSSIHLGLAGGGSTTGGSFVLDNLTIGASPTVIPEPSTLVLLGLGLTGVLAWRHRRRRA